jgi:hypothetical protein
VGEGTTIRSGAHELQPLIITSKDGSAIGVELKDIPFTYEPGDLIERIVLTVVSFGRGNPIAQDQHRVLHWPQWIVRASHAQDKAMKRSN